MTDVGELGDTRVAIVIGLAYIALNAAAALTKLGKQMAVFQALRRGHLRPASFVG